MKRTLLIGTLLIAAGIISTQAQPYKWGIGGRLGYPAGIPDFKINVSPHSAGEFMIEEFYHGGQVVGLYEYHGNISDDRFRWYAGGGGGVGMFWDYPYGNRPAYTGSRLALTAHGVVGLEYTFRGAPVNLSLDYKPQFEIFRSWWGYGGLALGIRYAR